jgi:threonine synthase
VVIAWEEMPKKYISLFKKYDAKLLLAKTFQQRSAMFKSFVDKGYFQCFLTINERKTKETLGTDGYEIISQEIIKGLRQVPDFVVIPTCYGDLAQGMFQGFKELGKIPQFILARAKDPAGDIAFSISTNSVTRYVKDVLKNTKGKSIFLTNDDFKKAKNYAKGSIGFDVEYSSAGAIAALEKLSLKEIKNKTIVLVLTALDR